MPDATAKPAASEPAAQPPEAGVPPASAARVSPAEPVIAYHPDAYEVARDDLKGRHSAGESFLSAFLATARQPEALAVTGRDDHFAAFEKAVKDAKRPLTARRVARQDIKALRERSLLHLPTPGLAEEARLRSFLGDDTYAICGVAHTVSSRAVIETVAQFVTAPVQPWDALICTSQAVHSVLSGILANTEDQLRARLGATTFVRPLMPVVPLGIHARRFTRIESARSRWRAKLGIADDAVVVMFFGRLSVHAKASPFQLAQALELAASKGARLEMIWCGYFSDDFQQKAFMTTAKAMAPSVRFHHVDGRKADARFSIWSAADIFCSLSDNIQESFGLTVIEAMAAELPTVAANWDGYRDAIQHGVTGVLVDSYMPAISLADVAFRYLSGLDSYDSYIGAVSQFCVVDVEQTAHWIATLAADPALRRKLGGAARQSVLKTYDWSAVLPRYRALWDEQLAVLDKARAAGTKPSIAWRNYDPALAFASYPSHRMHGGTSLTRGPHFELWEELVKMPGTVVNTHTLVRAAEFNALRAIFSDGGPRTIEAIAQQFAEPIRPLVVRALHWLVKIGLLQIAAGGSRGAQ
ncbi:MAG: glycosyltransferase family 4 protein [Xanthobacteraceae bacterium]|nr:glycosyltransferase family 4 protein [Xanthobacteraceae bacterium]